VNSLPALDLFLGLLLGAIAGSFIATLLIRWPDERSALLGRSRCDSCGQALGAGELVPVLSYLWLRGRCRRCRAAIDQSHFVIEVAAALIGLLAFVAFGGGVAFATALLGWWLLLIAALDLEHHWLPDRLTLPLLPLGLLVAWLGIGAPLLDRAVGAAAGFILLWLVGFLYLHLRKREGLGGGDPKLFGALGAWLGWQQLPFVLLGAGLLGLAAVLLKRARGQRVAATDRLPLGTLLALAAWPVWLIMVR
jgi:leader peptidase (prepilin peptidase)/N-methyltransferase